MGSTRNKQLYIQEKTGSSSTGPLYASVRVTDGKITNVENLRDDRDVTLFFISISDIYVKIASYYEKNSTILKNGQILRMDIRYNTQYHYPEYVSCGIFEPNPPNGLDGLYYELLDFQPTP